MLLKQFDVTFPEAKDGLSPIIVNKFTEEESKKFVEEVNKRALNDPHAPIVVHIDSYGGMVDSLAHMLNALDSVDNPLITVCTGKGMSCGAILLSHGDYRYAAPHSRVMVHEVSGGAMGNVNDILVSAEEMDRLNKYFMELLAKNCGKTYEELIGLMRGEKRDIYMDPKKALDFGIIDYVGVPVITKSVKYSLGTK